MLPGEPKIFEFIHIKSIRDLPHLLIVILLILGVGVGVYLAMQPQIFNKQAAEDGAIELKFIPETLKVETGKSYTVKIAINPKNQRVTAAELKIGYDPKVVSITDVTNSGFLPVTLRKQDLFDGNLTLVYGSTIESQTEKPGMVADLTIKVLRAGDSQISIKPDSQINISTQEGSAQAIYPILQIQLAASGSSTEEIEYPDSLLLEKAFLPDSSPFVRDFQEALEPKPELKPERINPELSGAYLKQLGTDIFISPIVALNDVLEEQAGKMINR